MYMYIYKIRPGVWLVPGWGGWRGKRWHAEYRVFIDDVDCFYYVIFSNYSF